MYRKRNNILEIAGAIFACIVILLVTVCVAVAKVQAYGGDESCLYVHCVKVK